MHFIDLASQQKRIRDKIESRIKAVLDHGQYIMGPEIKSLEAELALYTGSRHAVACSSGTDALILALMAHGISAGDAILTTPFTFFATAEAISLLGAIPVFVDIEPSTYNIDPTLIDTAIEAVVRRNSRIYPIPDFPAKMDFPLRGIMAVDLFGLPADYSKIKRIAKKHGLFLIEDAAQSFGAEYFGKKAGSLADSGCTSFFPAKPLGGYGDGGMCFTDEDSMAEKLRSIRNHGQGQDKYTNVRIGINGRLDTIQAAVLLAKLELFPEELELRQKKAEKYTALLGTEDSSVVCPRIPDGCLSAWAQYSVLTKPGIERSVLQEKLKESGIPTAIYYPRPLHLQEAFAGLGYKTGDFPVSEAYAKRIFSLPMHPYLQNEDQERIAKILEAEGV
jgi:UDP-2-acetamido-2-deoxy-ribo-hexuluronate aminotransferase